MAESPVPNEFQRPQGWRFAFEGVNLRDAPDTLKPTKFASAKNIRATSAQAVQTRPGYTAFFATGGNPVTDLAAYSTLGTDDLPRYLARDSFNVIYDDTGTLIVHMSGQAGFGAWMLPFRPSESPQSWMYVASLEDYQKISAPPPAHQVSGPTTTLAYKVGIAEPQAAIDAAPFVTGYFDFGIGAWSGAGAANRVTDTAGTVFADPLTASRYYVQVAAITQWGSGQTVAVNGSAANALIEQVFPPAPPMVVKAIRYYSGSTGRCTVSVGQIPNVGTQLGNLQRNSIVQFNPAGGEYCIVTAVVVGPDGSIAFETSTVGTIIVGAPIRGVPSITLVVASVVAGNALLGPILGATAGIGISTYSKSLNPSPFGVNTGVGTPESEDYIHISVKVADPTTLNEIRVQFSIGTQGGTPDYTTNLFYFAIQPALLAGVAANTTTDLNAQLSALTQTSLPHGGLLGNISELADRVVQEEQKQNALNLPEQTSSGANQWTEIQVPISSLTRVGGDASKSLEDCNGVQILFNTTAGQAVQWGSVWVGRQGQPDVGPDGADYKYRVVPRSSLTGVRGNPSPVMRYGVRPRRQQVQVTLPSAAYDPQIDTWDIMRYGGSVTSYRYIGSVKSTATTFTDNYGDAAARGGTAMEIDNFEPWPSVDVPFIVYSGGPLSITPVGPWITLAGGTGAWPVAIDRWLPGTLVQLGSQNAFTLRARPTQISASSYLFEVEECVSPNFVPSYFWVLEPKVAKNPNPYMWGPDVNGTFFGVGDVLRPGTVSFTKSNVPDSAPDKYNLDLCPPSEPLLGGVVKAGVSVCASTARWWALYPSFGSVQRYSPIEQPVGRGLVAPYAITTDGVLVWFWAKDCIAVTAGGPFESLTDIDLYNIFPHEGIPGVNITRFGLTYYAPDYSRCATFRLRKIKTYLFADYQDSTGTPRTLVMDLRTRGWSQDVYHDAIDVHFAQEQQSGSLSTLTALPTVYTSMLMADTNGRVWKELDCAGDNSNKIPCHIGTFEWDGGDQRMQPLWGDQYLDCVPQSQLTVTPISLGGNAAPATIIPANNSRQFVPISVQGGELNKFMGMLIEWTE